MKKIFFVFLVMSLTMLSGCTQYNGHIGPIFGSWSLMEMTEDGLPVDMEYETVFSFQNEVVQVMKYMPAPYTGSTKYGNFKLSDDILTLQFQAKPIDTDNYMYVTPDWLDFPMDGKPIHFDIKKLTGSEMILILDNEGRIITYNFKKTW